MLAALRARNCPTSATRARLRRRASPDRSGFAEAVATARSADVVVAVVGDQAGLFGHGTSGEGCDVTDLTLPGVQEELLQALADTGTPVVAVLVTGRPYALGERGRAGWPPWCRRSSPARRAATRSPGC